jgi:GNAT superfamily N-acetyltransferase
MPDMLVKLYDLGDDWRFIAGQKKAGITIRKPIGPEKHLVMQWVSDNFGPAWAAETDVALANVPRTCFVAVKDAGIIGFACYDATALGFFGPIGVDRLHRGKATGKALLKACLLDMKLKGYGYAVVGAVKDTDFFKKAVGAAEIPESTPGLYRTRIKTPESKI